MYDRQLRVKLSRTIENYAVILPAWFVADSHNIENIANKSP